MKTKMMVRICGAALAGLFAMGGVVAVPEVSPSTAMEVEAAVNPDAVNNTYYELALYELNKRQYNWTGDWEPIHGEDVAVTNSINNLNTKTKTYIVMDINSAFADDQMWNARYYGAKNADGTYTYNGYETYYNDMVASYPQLKTQIKNGWCDLSYNGIQKLIAAKVLPADCLVGRYSKAGTATTTTAPAAATTATASTDNIKKLQAAVVELTVHPATVYNGVDYSKEFNAAYYYIANPDLQTAIGVNAQGLLQHYVTYGKKEGRLAIAK